MPSTRLSIMSAVTSALSDIKATASAYNSTVAYVSESIKAYNECSINQFPACFPIDAQETKEHQTFQGSGDMSADLAVIITSMLYNRTGVTTTARANILQDIEKAMVTASQLATISTIWMTEVTKVTTDMGTIPMYSIHDQEVHFHYYYQSTDGG